MTTETMSTEFYRSDDMISCVNLDLHLLKSIPDTIDDVYRRGCTPSSWNDFWISFFLRNDPYNANLIIPSRASASMTEGACNTLGLMHTEHVEEIRRQRNEGHQRRARRKKGV